MQFNQGLLGSTNLVVQVDVGCEYYLLATLITHHQDEQGFKVALNLIGLNITVITANGMVMNDLSESFDDKVQLVMSHGIS